MSCTRKRSLSQIYSLASPEMVAAEEAGPKSGKWSAEEEMYANKLIAQFEAGTLTDCAEGSTLRSYLARKLNCAPMRISKKFAGQCIGKHTFTKKEPCVTPATDRDSLSEASTLTSSPAMHDDPLDFMSSKVVNTMSFDTFTEFQGRQECYTAPSSTFVPVRSPMAFPVPEKPRAGVTLWSNTVETISQSSVYPAQKRQLVSAFDDSAFESPCRAGDVGLDLDNMYSTTAAKVTPYQYARMTPPPVPAAEQPEKKDWGLKCTIPQYQYRPQSPSTVVPSGAAVVTPSHAATVAATVAAGTSSSPAHSQPVPISAFVPCPCPPAAQQCQQQYDACLQYDFCDPADLEAAEWRDVLDYFCGPQALYC